MTRVTTDVDVLNDLFGRLVAISATCSRWGHHDRARRDGLRLALLLLVCP